MGDAGHVASGTTRYLWDDVPTIWRSAVWFPVLVSGGVLAMAQPAVRWRAAFRPRGSARAATSCPPRLRFSRSTR